MRLTIVVLTAAALAAAGPALAKPKHGKGIRAYETPRAAVGLCQPMCTFDMTPCDPPEYKRADGRCASPVVGGTQMP